MFGSYSIFNLKINLKLVVINIRYMNPQTIQKQGFYKS